MNLNEFTGFAKKTLIEKLGDSGEDLLLRVMAKKPISGGSSFDEISEFIKTIEHVSSAISSREKAAEIGITLRKMVCESDKPAGDKIKNMDAEIEEFLKKNDLPSEIDILDYTKYLTLKYGGSAKKVEKELIEKVNARIKNTISKKKINEEIAGFLTRYPQPAKTDVDDFINYIRLSKLSFQENELREQIEKERLFRKFHEPLEAQKFGYLIKDEPEVYDKSVSEFVELLTPKEEDMKDALEGLGLKHMIYKK